MTPEEPNLTKTEEPQPTVYASSSDDEDTTSQDDDDDQEARSDATLHPSEDERQEQLQENEHDNEFPLSVTEGFLKLTVEEIKDDKQDKLEEEQQEEEDPEVKNAPASLRALASWIDEGKCDRILVLTGAGVSVAAGIPDFRTPGTGLYDNLQQYNLPFPEAVFDLGFYRHNPQPFTSLAQEMWPGVKHAPTLTHSFIALLAEKNLLLRNYSQNIDGLEFVADTPADLLVECHGHYRTATCIDCQTPADPKFVQASIVDHAKAPECTKCGGLVKPDIVFFGESLPFKFHTHLSKDKHNADLILVLGTSLQVAPVSHIPEMVPRHCKRVLINRDLVGSFQGSCRHHHQHNHHSKNKKNTSKTTTPPPPLEEAAQQRDLFVEGNCDDNIRVLAKLLGWYDELKEKHDKSVAAIRQKQKGATVK